MDTMDVNLEPVLGPSSRHALARQAAEAKTRGSAVSFALGQADLLAHISSYVDNKKDLKSLCLVNRAFHATFVPKIFRELHIWKKDLTDEGRAASLLSNRQTCHVQLLKIQWDIESTVRWALIRLNTVSPALEQLLKEEIFQTLSVNTNKLVSCMPGLMGFHSDRDPVGSEYVFDLLRHNAISKACRSTYEAPILMLNVGWGSSDHWSPQNFRTLLSMHNRFFNLKSLTLGNLPHAPEQYADIAHLLFNSPQLKFLSLSSIQSLKSGLESLCNQLRLLGAPQLSLETLHLGRGFEMTASQTEPMAPCDAYKARANYLSKLTNLHRLRNLQLDGDNALPVAWGTLTPSLLPNLRSLTIQDSAFRPLSALCKVGAFKKHFRPFSGTQAGQDFKQQIVFTIGSRWMAFLHRDAISFGGMVSSHNPRVNFWADLEGADELGAFFGKTRMLRMAVDELDRFYAQLLVCNSLEAVWIHFPIQLRESWETPPSRTQQLQKMQDIAKSAADHCPTLRYIKIETEIFLTGYDRYESCYRPMPGSSILQSWTIIKKPMPESRYPEVVEEVVTQIEELSEAGDEAMCPRGFWSMERKLQHLSSLDGLAESDSDEFWWRGPGE